MAIESIPAVQVVVVVNSQVCQFVPQRGVLDLVSSAESGTFLALII